MNSTVTMFQNYQYGILVPVYFPAYKSKVSVMLIYQISLPTCIFILPLNALITTDYNAAITGFHCILKLTIFTCKNYKTDSILQDNYIM